MMVVASLLEKVLVTKMELVKLMGSVSLLVTVKPMRLVMESQLELVTQTHLVLKCSKSLDAVKRSVKL